MKKFLIAPLPGSGHGHPGSSALCVSERGHCQHPPSKDGKLLTLKMRDGRVLVNHLQGVCTDLRFNGFVWVLRGTNDICENQQSLRVMQSGQICLLGQVSIWSRTTGSPDTGVLRPRRLLLDDGRRFGQRLDRGGGPVHIGLAGQGGDRQVHAIAFAALAALGTRPAARSTGRGLGKPVPGSRPVT